MIKSPVKFDDLAFILLFFFMILSVVSMSDSKTRNSTEISSPGKIAENSSIVVRIESDNTLTVNGEKTDISSFGETDIIDLSCSDNVMWSVVADTVKKLTDNGADVSIVV